MKILASKTWYGIFAADRTFRKLQKSFTDVGSFVFEFLWEGITLGTV